MFRLPLPSCKAYRKLMPCFLAIIWIVLADPASVTGDPLKVKAVVLRHWPPQYQIDEFGTPTGFAIDVLDHVAASTNLDISYQVVDTWEEMFETLRKGDADLIPNQGITAERKEWFAFTSPVETFQVSIFVRESTTDILDATDLSGRVVATVEYNIATRLMNHRKDITHRVFSDLKEAFWELLAGNVDALIYPQPVLMKLAMEAGLESRIKVAGDPLVEIKRGISVLRDNRDLLNQLEPGVRHFVRSHKYEEIYAKWYGTPSPFWTTRRILLVMIGVIFLLTLLHAIRVSQVNRKLKGSILRRKKAEADLRDSEEKYRLIVENQSDMTVKLDNEGRIRFGSPSFRDALGVSRKDHLYRPFLSIVHPDDREKIQLAMQSLQVAPHACSYEGRILTPRGWRWFAWSNKAIIDERGHVREIIAVGRDTTERRQAEDRLQESEEKFRAIFEQAADGVVLIDIRTLSIADCNVAAHRALGYARNELIRTKLNNLIVPGPLGSIASILEMIMDSNGRPVDAVLRTKSGKKRHYVVTQRPLAINGGTYSLGVWHDITDRKELEEHLVHSQKMEAIGTLAGGVAHDFNNILSIIIGNTELAGYDIETEHPAWERLEAISTAGVRAKEVVRQLLSISRREQENRSPVQLAALVEESLKLLRASIPANIEIRKHIVNSELPLMADATQIHQILINLCTNAAQAMTARGGAIDITLSSITLGNKRSRRLGIKPGDYAQMLVKDSGCGIRPDILDRIFDPYFTTKKGQDGTGLGLSIVHGIATRHNGAIDVSSRLGLGTTFQVLLPLAAAVSSDPIHPDIDHTTCTGHESILLVDDEPSIVILGKEYLEKLGYKAHALGDAIEALELIRAAPDRFDLVITDMAMPHITGEELAGKVLKLNPGIPIILCSGYHSGLDVPSLLDKGITLFLQKPYTIKELGAAIRKALSAEVDNQALPSK